MSCDTLALIPSRWTSEPTASEALVLIRVPTLTVGRVAQPTTRRRPGRRRLRREVRWGGSLLLVLTCVGLGLLHRGGVNQAFAQWTPTLGSAADEVCDPCRVSLSFEPLGPSVGESDEEPVVLKGYLLPDEVAEESRHAGP